MISIKTVKKSRAGRVSQTGRIILSGLFLLGVGTPVFAEPVGKVLVVTGTAQAQAATGPVRVLVPGAPLERGDSLITAADSNLQVRFVDGALLMVRPNSRIRIDDYRAEGNNLHSVMSLLVGGIRSLTGRIGKTRRDEYLMNTSTASIGVRGTDYELRLCQGDCPAGSADGLYLGVMDGGIVARNDAGAFDLNAHEYGLIRNHKAALEKLDCPPEALTGVPCTARGATSSMDPGMGYRAGENLERDGLPSAFSRGSLCAAPGPPNCDPQITASCVPLYPSCQ